MKESLSVCNVCGCGVDLIKDNYCRTCGENLVFHVEHNINKAVGMKIEFEFTSKNVNTAKAEVDKRIKALAEGRGDNEYLSYIHVEFKTRKVFQQTYTTVYNKGTVKKTGFLSDEGEKKSLLLKLQEEALKMLSRFDFHSEVDVNVELEFKDVSIGEVKRSLCKA